jgi:hypothetical protein
MAYDGDKWLYELATKLAKLTNINVGKKKKVKNIIGRKDYWVNLDTLSISIIKLDMFKLTCLK